MKQLKKLVYMLIVLSMCLTLCAFSVSAADVAYGAATVNATSLNVRSGPDTSYDRVTVLSSGTIVVILEKTNSTWYKINYNGYIGYVNTDYLTNVLTAENFNATGTVNGTSVRARSTPSTDGNVVAMYDTGDVLPVIGINNGWYKISDGNVVGYIRSDLMDITGGSASVTSSSASSLGQEIANYALNYVGYSYVYGAESPSTGFDCSGLVYYVYGQYGYSLSRTASQQYKNNGTHVSKSELQQGDLVFFSSNGYSVTHVGIYIGDGQFVHASTSKTGVIISDLNSDYYTRVWFGATRIV
ncbi:MAG: NlpC/P60 family protein [Oscillospiraceae bacterium]